MATTAATVIQRARRFLGDWPENDALTASAASNSTTLTVADATIYSQGWLLQVDTESMYVTANGVGTSVSVRRAQRGSTATTHASAATVLMRPHFLDVDYFDALNAAVSATFPMLYQAVVDESITTVATTYEYTIPSLDTVPIPYISRVQHLQPSDTYRDVRSWTVLRGTTPKLKLRRPLPVGTMRIYGFGPLPLVSSLTGSLDVAFPTKAEDALVYYMAQHLMASGEARRVREDTGARDDREAANRPGSSMNASNQMLQRFYARLAASAMPPMPKNVVPVI